MGALEERNEKSHYTFRDTDSRFLLVSFLMDVDGLLSVLEPVPSSLSSYSTLKPEIVEEAEVHDTTKLFDVISVTDSEVSTSGGGGVVSPSAFSTRKTTERKALSIQIS